MPGKRPWGCGCISMGLRVPSVLRRKRFWGSALAVAFLAWCLYDLDLREVGLIVRRLRYTWLILAMCVVIAVLWVQREE